MATKKTIDRLSQVPLFESFSKSQLSKLHGLLKEEHFNAGEDIVTKGDPGGRFYILTQGRAQVIKGRKPPVNIGPGRYFGEMSLLDDDSRSATVRATTEVTALSLSRIGFLSILEDNWSLTKRVLKDLCARVRDLEASI